MDKALFLILFGLISARAFGQNWPPEYQDRRFLEDWKPADTIDFRSGKRNILDAIKYLPTGEKQKVWASFGGQLRLRYMGTINEEFKDSQSGLFTMRTRLHGALNVNRRFRLFAEGIYSNTTDDNRTRLGIGTPVVRGALLNGFGEFTFGKLDGVHAELWAGRRELQMGHERLVSPGNWLMTRRSWDGFGFNLKFKKHQLEGFLTQPVIVAPEGYAVSDNESIFAGIGFVTADILHGTSAGIGRQSWSEHTRLIVEPYLFYSKRKNITFEDAKEIDKRYTLGVLVSGPIKSTPWSFEIEGLGQTGSNGTKSIYAASITAELGYAFRNLYMRPHLWVGVDYSTGDRENGDDQLNTFDPLYAQVSSWFGEHGMMDRKNLSSFSINLDTEPVKNLYARLTYWYFLRSNSNDAIYNTTNGILRSSITSNNHSLGHSAQAALTYNLFHNWQFSFTYDIWAPGGYFEETQLQDVKTQHFFMVTSQLTF